MLSFIAASASSQSTVAGLTRPSNARRRNGRPPSTALARGLSIPALQTADRRENAPISDGCPRQARLNAKGALIWDFILEDARLREQKMRGDGGLAPQNTIANAAAGIFFFLNKH